MCFDHDGYADAYVDYVRKARKEHTCNDCHEKIAVGQLYIAISGIFDSEPFSSCVCGACSLTRFRIALHELGEGCEGDEIWCPVGELQEWLYEYNDYDAKRYGKEVVEESTQAEGQWHLARMRARGPAERSYATPTL